MKKFTFGFNILFFFILALPSKPAMAQNPCSASFVYTMSPQGVLTFSSTSTTTSSGTTYYWYVYSMTNTFSTASPNFGATGAFTLALNGVYVLGYSITNSAPTCSSNTSQTFTVTNLNTPCNLSANFSTNQTLGGNVVFGNNTSGTFSGTLASTTYSWNFGDNSSSTATSPVHTYSANGSYSVILIANKNLTPPCISTTSAVVLVNSICPPLTANFNYFLGNTGNVTFSNTSIGTNNNSTYIWNFGDASYDYNANAMHTYSVDGLYSVKLFVNNSSPYGACTSSVNILVQVCSHASLTSSFVYSVSGNTFNFTSTSTGTNNNTIYNWSSTVPGAVTASGTNVTQTMGTFPGAGTYTVLLTTFNPGSNCSSSSTQVIVITNTCIANAGFSLTPTTTPQVWNAIPAAPNNIVSAVWNWGDGSTSNTLFTTHTYSASGTYSICLTVTNTCGASASFCSSYFVSKNNGANSDPTVIQINVIDLATVGIKRNIPEDFAVVISPNPSNGSFNLKISSASGSAYIGVYDLQQKLIYKQLVQNNNGQILKEIKLNDAAVGIYFLRAEFDGKSITKKLIVEK